MKKNITAKILSAAAILCAAPLALAASDTREQGQALTKELQKAAAEAAQVQALDISTINTTWERCEVLVSRSRGNGRPRVRVVKPWTCKDVTTSCSAVVSKDKIFAPAACYYASKKKNQTLSLKSSHLVSSDGRRRSLLKSFIGKVKDFVVFRK